MAEYAQLRTEELTPIMEEIRQLNLLSPAKRKKIMSEMTDHEYRIQKSERQLKDVLGYVEYQLGFLELIRRSREELQEFSRVNGIEDKIQNRISSLFGSYQRNFCSDLEYWQARLNFTLGQKWLDQASKVYKQLTSFLGKQHPYLWQKASEFEWKRSPMKGIDTARKILQLGIRGDNHNLDLYIWTFELELKHIEFLYAKQKKAESQKRQSNLDYEKEIEKCFNAARAIYKEAKNNCWGQDCTVKLYIRFHSVASNFPVAKNLEIELLKDLESNCSSEEDTYHVLAILAFKSGDIETGRKKLEMGLEVLQTVKMYELAVNDLFSLVQDKPSKEIFNQLHNILNQGHNNDKLSVLCYVKWSELVPLWEDLLSQASPSKKTKGSVEKEDSFPKKSSGDILEMGLKKYPRDPKLIVAKTKALFNHETWEVEEIFDLIAMIGNNSETTDQCYEELCSQLLISFMLDRSNRMTIEHLVDRAKDFKLKEKLSILYLKHLALQNTESISEIRKFFEKATCKTYSLYYCMAQIEFRHSERCSEKLRDLMEKACQLFGQTDVAPWLDFIRFEKLLKRPDRSTFLYQRALKVLPEHLQEKFMSAELANANNKKMYS